MVKIKTTLAFLFVSTLLFLACENNSSNPQEEGNTTIETEEKGNNKYQLMGQEFAQQTQTSLATKLKKAIGEGDFHGAITFCNINALPITDSMSKALNASIKRVSDQARNKANQAKEGELFYIEMSKKALAKNEEVKPFISEDEKSFLGYYPIITNTMCLNCHGDKSDINANTLAKLNELYPDDKAQGYKSNELRGLFVVKINK